MGLLFGVLFGLLELCPNMHPQILALALLPALPFGVADKLMFASALLITSMHLHVLTHTYHPIPKALLLNAEPAQRLAYQGFGPTAIAIQLKAIPLGTVGVACTLPLLLLTPQVMQPLLLTLTGGLLLLTLRRAKRKWQTLLVIATGTLVGHLAGVKLQDQAMTPLLTGLFTLPPLLHLLSQPKDERLPANQPYPDLLPKFQLRDAFMGALAAVLPGISASSLAHLTSDEQIETPVAYLTKTSLQHSSAQFTAYALFLALGQRHSAAAVLLGATVSGTPTWYLAGFGLLGLLLAGLFARNLTRQLAPAYKRAIQWANQKYLALGLLPIALWTVWHHAHLYGLVLMAAAASVSLLQKHWQAPNQALVQAITLPVVWQLLT